MFWGWQFCKGKRAVESQLRAAPFCWLQCKLFLTLFMSFCWKPHHHHRHYNTHQPYDSAGYGTAHCSLILAWALFISLKYLVAK